VRPGQVAQLGQSGGAFPVGNPICGLGTQLVDLRPQADDLVGLRLGLLGGLAVPAAHHHPHHESHDHGAREDDEREQ
jgi:hypothetical protein